MTKYRVTFSGSVVVEAFDEDDAQGKAYDHCFEHTVVELLEDSDALAESITVNHSGERNT